MSDDLRKKFGVIAGGVVALAVTVFAARKFGGKKAKKIDAFVFSGPSGVGKGTMISRLLREHRESLSLCVSHTTRAPRAGEIDGSHYHFVDQKDMLDMIGENKFLEVCQVHDNIYGTSKAALEHVTASGKTAIIEIDVKGAEKIKMEHPELNVHFVFIQAPSMKDLEERIRGRDGSSAKVELRLATAEFEMAFIKDHTSLYNTIITNDDLERAYTEIETLMKSKGCF